MKRPMKKHKKVYRYYALWDLINHRFVEASETILLVPKKDDLWPYKNEEIVKVKVVVEEI